MYTSIKFGLGLLLVLGGLPAAATEIHVDPVRGDDANPGTTAAPLKTLKQATTRAVSGDAIVAAPGLYGPAYGEPSTSVTLREGVTLRGAGSRLTILEGLDGGHYIGTSADSEVSGFTLRGPRGWGIRIAIGASPPPFSLLIRDVRFLDSQLEVVLPDTGFGLAQTEIIIDRCEFTGPSLIEGSFLIRELLVSFPSHVVTVALTNSLFRDVHQGVVSEGRQVGCGGVLAINLTLVNNTFIDVRDSAVVLETGPCNTLTVSRLSNNLFAGAVGYGVEEVVMPSAVPATVVEVANNLFFDTAAGVYLDAETGAKPTAADLDALPEAFGNFDATPLFVGATAADYRLAPGSPGIDAGLDAAAPANDHEGDPRPLDGDGDLVPVVDIGYDELRPGPELLRNTDVTQLAPLTPARALVLPLATPRDDYWSVFPTGGVEDPGVLANDALVLVFYQLVRPGNGLFLTKTTEVKIWQ